MDEQTRSRSSYPYDSEERRNTALPSLNTSLQCKYLTVIKEPSPSTPYCRSQHSLICLIFEARESYAAGLASGQTGARQGTHVPGGYTHTGPATHTAYDPVHDAYDYPRIASPGLAQPAHGFIQQGYPRAERTDIYNYGGGDRFSNMDTLPPIRQQQHYDHPPQSATHDVGAMHQQTPTYPPRGDTGYPAYQMQTATHPGTSQFQPQQGMHQAVRGDNQSAPYSSLPPLSIPGERPSSSDGKGGAKRIVMACHAWSVNSPLSLWCLIINNVYTLIHSRNRKIRCDAARPACANCVRRREDCQYDAKPRRRGPDKVPGSRMRSCKSRKQGMGEESPSASSAGFQSPSSATFFPSPS